MLIRDGQVGFGLCPKTPVKDCRPEPSYIANAPMSIGLKVWIKRSSGKFVAGGKYVM